MSCLRLFPEGKSKDDVSYELERFLQDVWGRVKVESSPHLLNELSFEWNPTVGGRVVGETDSARATFSESHKFRLHGAVCGGIRTLFLLFRNKFELSYLFVPSHVPSTDAP